MNHRNRLHEAGIRFENGWLRLKLSAHFPIISIVCLHIARIAVRLTEGTEMMGDLGGCSVSGLHSLVRNSSWGMPVGMSLIPLQL